jgi:hypothetical protein
MKQQLIHYTFQDSPSETNKKEYPGHQDHVSNFNYSILNSSSLFTYLTIMQHALSTEVPMVSEKKSEYSSSNINTFTREYYIKFPSVTLIGRWEFCYYKRLFSGHHACLCSSDCR